MPNDSPISGTYAAVITGSFTIAADTIDTVLYEGAVFGNGPDAVLLGPGTLESSGSVSVNNGGGNPQLVLGGGVDWENGGTVYQAGVLQFGTASGDSATIVNQAGALYDLTTGNAQLQVPNPGSYSFVNGGVLEMTGGGANTVSAEVINSGLVASDNGNFYLADVDNSAGGTLLGNSYMQVEGGVLGGTIEGNVALMGTYGVPINTTQTVTFAAPTFEGAVLEGPGTLQSNGVLNILNGGGNAELDLAGGVTFDNVATVYQGGILLYGLNAGDTATIHNESGATWDLTTGNSQLEATNPGTYSFVNDGVLEMTGGGGNTVSVPLTNNGLVSADNGNMYLAGPFTNAGTLQTENGAYLQLDGGVLGGTIQGNVAITGAYTVAANTTDAVAFGAATFEGAVVHGAGTLLSNGNVHIQNAGGNTSLTLGGGITLENAGVFNQDGILLYGTAAGDSATIVNQAGATWVMDTGNSQLEAANPGTYAFVNDGLMEMTGGGGNTVAVPLDNNGVVTANNGNMFLAGPITNSGTLQTSGGFLELEGGVLGGLIQGNIYLIGSYLAAANTTVTVTFSGATLGNGAAAVFDGPGTLVTNGQVNIDNNGGNVQLVLAAGITWENAASVSQAGILQFGGASGDTATVLNDAGATWSLTTGNGQQVVDGSGTYNFINAGLLQMVGGGNITLSPVLTNTGVVTTNNGNLFVAGGFTNSGTLQSNGGNLYLEGGVLGGTIQVNPQHGGNVYVFGTYAVAAGTQDDVTFGSVFLGDGNAAVLSGAGTLSSVGLVTVFNNGGNPSLLLTGGVTWDSDGTVHQDGQIQFGTSAGDSATLVNAAGATYVLTTGNSQISPASGGGSYGFVNDGLLEMTGGGNNTISVPLTNAGVVSANNGNLIITGSFSNSGTMQTGGGQMYLEGGTLGGSILASNGALYLLDTFAVAAGTTDTVTFNQATFGDGTAATLAGSGTLVTNGELNILYNGGNPSLLLTNGVAWDNNATVNQAGGLQFGTGAGDSTDATVVNEAGATYDLTTGSAQIYAGGTGSYSFVNDGLLAMTGGGTNTIYVPLTNNGVVSANNGTFVITDLAANTGTMQTGGGALFFEGGVLGGTILASNGGVNFIDTYTVQFGETNSVTLESAVFGDGTAAELVGSGTLVSNGSARVNYNGGNVQLTIGGGITWDSSLTLFQDGVLQFGTISGDTATLVNQAGGTIDMDNGAAQIVADGSGNYTLVNAGLLEMTGGGTNNIGVAVNETATGTISDTNGNLNFNAGGTIGGAVTGNNPITFNGNVTVTATGDVTASHVTFNSGTLFMQGGTVNSPNLTLGSGEHVVGYGALGDPAISSIIVDASGGLLTVTGPVNGAPNYEIETGATLELTNGSARPVTFDGTEATLKLDSESGFSGTLNNFAGGDTIDLPGITLSAVSYVGGDLIGTLQAGGTISLAAPGVDASLQLEHGTDTSGVSTIYLQPSTVAAVPDLLTALDPNNGLVLPDAHVFVAIAVDPNLEIENAATAPADGLNVNIASITGSAFAHGQINSLAPGAIDDSSIGVGLNDLTAGAESGSVGLDYQTDGSVSGIAADLGTQTLNLSGNVYRLAEQTITAPSNVYLHVGDGVGTATEALTIANTDPADGYSEGLDAAATGVVSGNLLSASGSTGDLAAGGSDSSSVTVSFSTATAGTVSGYVAVGLTSDGTGVDSLGLTPLGYSVPTAPTDTTTTSYDLANDWSQTDNPNGTWAYLQGSTVLPYQANLSSLNVPGFAPGETSGNFLPAFFESAGTGSAIDGHSVDSFNGDPGLGESTLTWTAPVDGTIDISGYLYYGQPAQDRSNDFFLNLGGSQIATGTVSYLSYYDQAHEDNLSFSGLAVTAGEVLSLTLQRSAGYAPGTITTLDLNVDETSPVGSVLGNEIPVSAVINNYATAAIQQAGGAGTLTAIGNTYTLDFGSVAAAPGEISGTLDLANIATGQADWLSGSLTASGDTAFSDVGLGSTGTLFAGDSTPLSIDLSTVNAGTFSQTITLAARSINPDGGTLLPGETIVVKGTVLSTTVLAQPVINEPSPVVLPDVHVASLVPNDQLALDISNTGSDTLSGFVSAATGDAYGSGIITDLAPGGTDTTGIVAGLNNTQAGALSGTVNLSFTSGTNDVALPPQTVTLEGNAYRYAAPSVSGPVNAIVHVGDGVSDTDSETLIVQNTATADGFSENLDATALAVVSGNLTGAGGTASDIAAGTTNSAGATFSFSTATAGTVSGQVAVAEISDGSGIDTLGTTLLGTVDVPVSVTVDNYATAAIQQTGGAGDLVQNGSVYTLNLGAFAQGVANPGAQLDVANIAAGPADLLSGSLSSDGGSAFAAYYGDGSVLSATYFEVSSSGNGPDFGGGGTPNVANGSTLGPDGLPVASTPAGIADVDPSTGQITWWDPSLNSGVVQTGTGLDSLPYGSNMYAPDSTGPNDGSFFETAILRGTFSLDAPQSVTFQVGSDDDSFIYVDGTLIGQNPGIHGTETQNFTATNLAAGSHTVEIFYDDRDQSGANLNVNVLTPDVTITPANTTGLGGFGGVAAGGNAPFAVNLSTANSGVFTETITLAATGSNASGYSAALNGETLVVTGTVLSAASLANPVIDNGTTIALADAHVASPANDQTFLDISNTGSDVLSGYVAGTSGAASGSGAFQQLPPGDSDSSDITVGLNNTSDGVKSGSVTLGFSSGGDNLITDGSFEDSANFVGDGNNTEVVSVGSTIMPGWTVTAGNPLTWDGPGGAFGITAEAGRFYLDLTGYADSQPYSGVTQTIATTVGEQYQLSFELGSSANYGLPASLTATAGGTSQIFTSTETGTHNWQRETLDFTATGTTTEITLAGDHSPSFIGVDDVSVTPVGAPSSVALNPQTVAVTGTVYNYGTASISLPGTVWLHVGDDGGSAAETLNVANTASTDGYSEGIDVAGAAGLGGVAGTSGSSGDIEAGQTADAALTVNVSTAFAANGVTAAVSEVSDGTNVDTLGTTNLGTVDVPLNIIVDNYATAEVLKTGGNGTVVPTGITNVATFDLGSTYQYANPLYVTGEVLNAAQGPAADQLSGTFGVSGDPQFSNTGLGDFSGVNFGNADTSPEVMLNTGTIGTFSETIVVYGTGSDASGYSGTLTAETIDVIGTILPVPPPPPPPLPTAVAWGDVHLTSFDGLYYDFQAEGEFILAQSTVPGDTFAVQARMAPFSANSTVSVMTMIGAKVGTDQVTFGLGRDDVVALNGTGIALANGETHALSGGGSITQLTSNSFQLNWGTGEVMNVTDGGSYFNLNLTLSAADGHGSIQGLLGSDTGQANDFQLADGTVLAQPLTSAELYGAFANAWRVTDGNSLMDYVAGQHTASFTDVNFPADAVNIDNLPAAILQQAELEVQQAGITDPNQQAAAVLDLLVTGDPNALLNDVGVGQNGQTTTAAEISVPPPPVPALGVSAAATNVVETAGGTTSVTFNAYLTNVSGTDTVIKWDVTSPNATYLPAASLGSNPVTGFVTILAGQTTGQFTVTLPTGVLGTDPSDNLQVSISSTNGDPVFGKTAQTEIDNYQPQAGNPAVPVVNLAAGSGTFSGSDGNYTLDLGTLVAGEAPLQDRFQIANDALAPSDLLAGSITASGNNFTVYGATQLSPLGAGTSYQGLVTETNTSATGAQSETIVFHPVDENITGYSSIQATQTITITDTVLPDAVGDLLTGGPINLGTFYQGGLAETALDIENAAGAGAAALDVTASSSGQANVTGTINQLAPGGTDVASIEAGIDTSSPGVKTGFVTLHYASDAGNGNTAGASNQQIQVIGTVYGPATASLSAPTVYVHKGDNGGNVTAPITIRNTGSNNGFTEKLSGQIVAFGTYVTAASGSITDLAPGLSNSTSLTATLSDANYGVYAGEVQVALQSDGTGIDSEGTTSLGFAYVQAAIAVDQYAVAAMEELSGNGTMVPAGVASHYSLDLGTVAQYATPLGANLGVLNDVLGQADLLAGSFQISGAPQFTNAGFQPFGAGTEIAGLAAQRVDGDPVVVLSSGTVGVFTETITLNASGYNPDDPAGYALAPETVTITGTVVAAPPPTPVSRVSNAWGDVHLTTFDGLYYNFQAAGEFVLAQSTVPGDSFAIQARMQPYGGSSSVSVNTMVAAQVGNDRVTFGIDRTDTVWIDGHGVSLSGSPVVTLADGTLEQTSADTYRVVWNTGEELDITDAGSYLNAIVSLPNSDAGEVQGLLGNDDGNPATDLALPNGTPIETGGSISYAQLYGTYAASWEVSDSTSLMDYQAGQDAASFFNPNFPYNQILLGNLPPNAYQLALAAAQAAGITDPNLLQAAIVDYLFTGNPQALQASENVQQQEGGNVTAGQTVTSTPAPIADVGVLANQPTVVELTGTADAIGFTAYLTSAETADALIRFAVNGNAGPGFLNASDFPGDILPNGTVTIAAGQTSALFTVAIPANVLGSRPDENLQVVISPVNPQQSVFAPFAQTEILNTGPTAGNPATPLVEQLSGDGVLTGSGTAYELNLGAVEQYSNPLVAGYGVENNGVVPADLLSGSFLDAGSSQFLNSGLSPFAPIATGNADTAPEVELLTNQVGTFTETVTLTPTDSNLTNYSSIMPLVTIEVVGTIYAPPPPPPPPEPVATAWGDVHLTTFDGVYYNFQAAGEYVLTRSTVAGDTFQVQDRLAPYGAGSSVTVQTQVGAAIGSDDVVFALTGAGYNASPLYLNGTAEVYLNGTAEALGIGQTLNLSGGSVTETSANTYRVNWATGESMTVTENGSYISDTIQVTAADAGKLQGLLGPDDGNPSTDLQLPNGQSIASGGTISSSTLYGTYANDWQVPNTANSLLYYTAGQSPSSFVIPGFPENALALSQLPANLVAAAEAIVRAEGITDPNLVDAAVIDLLVTGDPNSVFSSANVQEEGALLNSAAVSIPTPLPSVGIFADSTTALEPTSGTLAVDYTIYLTAAAAQTSTINYSVTGSGPNNLGAGGIGGIVGGTGSGVVQIAAGQTSAQIVVDVLANALGSLPDAELQVGVTATGGETLFGGSAETEIVNPTPTAGNPAKALIEQLSGNGHLSGSGTDYVLNLGTQVQNGSPLYANLGIENGATQPADGLSGQFTITDFQNFLNTGFTPFSSVAPGAADTEPAISLGTGTIGVYTETVVLKPTDTNPTGYSQPQNDVTLTVTGTIVPMPLPPPPSIPTATAWGDVHLTTFDGLYYNFQAVGEFTLAKSTVAGDSFNVQIRTTQYGGSSVSVIDQLAAGIGSNAVTFGTSASQPATVLLNGGAANFVNGVLTLADGTVTEESPTSYVVNWNTGESLTVTVAGSYVNTTVALASQDQNGHVQGLLGYDSGVNNDFAPIVSGTTITTNQLYYGSGTAGVADSLADYWRVPNDGTSLLYYAPGTDTADYTDLGFPADAFSLSDLPAALQQAGLQAAIQAGITDPQLRQAAALDFIVTGDPNIVTGGANVQQQGLTTTNSSVTGAVLTPALGVAANNAALVEPASGNLNVGFTVYLTQAEAQATTVDWGVDAPNGGYLDASDFAGGILPSGSIIIAAGSTSASFSVEVNAGVLAALPSSDLQVTIAATGTEAVFAPSAQTTIVNNHVEQGTPSDPLFALLGGEGTLTQIGNDYTLALGNFTQGATVDNLSLAVENAAAIGANSLAGSLVATSIPGYSVYGTGPLPEIAAGSLYQGLHVVVNTETDGNNSETITFTPQDQNASGYSSTLTPLTLTITDSVTGNLASASAAAPNPVDFHNVHVDSTPSQTLSLENSAPTSGGSENLDGSIGSATGAATDNGGSFTGLNPGAINTGSLSVGLVTTSEGVQSGSAVVSLESDGTGIDSNGISPLPSQTIDVFGTVYGYAAPILSGTTLNFGAVRVGDTVTAHSLSISDGTVVDPYQESLIYALQNTPPTGFSAGTGDSGTIVSGGTALANLNLKTTTAGNFNATDTLSLTSTGLGTSGLANSSLGSDTITLEGKVYAAAVAQVGTSLNFGVVHVGATTNKALSVKNTASGALTDVVIGNAATVTGTGFSSTGSLGIGVAAGGTGKLILTLSSATSGVVSGSATLALASHDANQADLGLPVSPVTLTGTVDNYATAAISEVSGEGTLTKSGRNYTLNLNTLSATSSPVVIDLAVGNTATGLADLLSGSFTETGSAAFINNGFAAFSGAGAGQTATIAPSITLAPGTFGSFTETFTLVAQGSNASGYNGTLTPQTLTVTGMVLPVIDLASTPLDVINGAGNVTIVATSSEMFASDQINGGGGTNTLDLQGGGVFNLAALSVLSNIQVVNATEGLGAASPNVFLRNGLNLTVNLLDPAGTTGATVHGANDADIINLGAGTDSVVLGSAGETVNGGSGTGLYYVTAATIGATINGGTGTNDLYVQGGGTLAMGSNITGMNAVFLVNAGTSYNFTANATPGMVIHASTDNDTITVGDASQTVIGSTGNLLVLATADEAGVAVEGATSANTTLEITTGGTITLNSADRNVTVQLDAASTLFLPGHSTVAINAVASGSTIVATDGLLSAGDQLVGGSGVTTLALQGNGSFNLAAPTVLSNIQVVDVTEGQAGALPEPAIVLRDGTDLTLNVLSDPSVDPSNPSLPGVVIHGANNDDVINFGSGKDLIYLGGTGETVIGGSGADKYAVTAATIGATIEGGSGSNVLAVQGGGTLAMGSNITGMNSVVLAPAGTSYNFTANATSNMVIYASTDSDTITVGSASQTVIGSTGNLLVLATAANAGVAVEGGTATTTLEITTSGTIALNSADRYLTVQLDAANTTLMLDHFQFIHAVGAGGNDLIIADSKGQVLTGGGANDTLDDAGHYGVTFQDTVAGFAGDTLADFTRLDTIDITNLTGVTGAPIYTGTSSSGSLAVIGSTGTVDIHMTNLKTGGVFNAVSDTHGGTLITYA